MAKGIEIGIASETKAFKQGVEAGIIKPVENAIESLDDLGKNRGPEKLEQSMEDAQTATERLKRETKETADTIERDFRESYRGVAKSAKDGTDQAGEGFRNFKAEAVQNVSEVASSFSGELDDAVSGVQGTLGGLTAALSGPAALAAAGAAVGVGFISSALEQAQDDADELAERFSSMFRVALEEGRAYLDEAQIQSGALDILVDPEKKKAALEDAKKLGLDLTTILLAQAGDQDAVNVVLQRGVDLRVAQNDELFKADGKLDGQAANIEIQNAQLDGTLAKYRDVGKLLDENKDALQTALEIRQRDNDVILDQNKALAETPASRTVKVLFDDSDLTKKLSKSRAINVTVNGYTRTGQRVV